MSLQPRLDVGMLVGTVVIHHQVQNHLAGKCRIDAAHESQKLLMAVAAKALTNDFALQDFQGREQASRAVALVVVGHRPQAALLHGQSRLRAIQRLNLGLFIHTQHQGLVRGIQIQAHHIGQLLHKARIARQLEALGAVRLQVVAAPDRADRGFAHALRLRHLPATPLRHPIRLRQQRRLDNRLDLARRVGGLASATCGNLPQALRTGLRKSPAP